MILFTFYPCLKTDTLLPHYTSTLMQLTSAVRVFTLPGVLILLAALPSFATAQSTNACVAQGNTLQAARLAHAAQCSVPVTDCDPVPSGWVCSSNTITQNLPVQPVTAPAAQPLVTTAPPNSTFASCFSTAADTDGDGYGWENNATCLVTGPANTTAATTGNTVTSTSSPTPALPPINHPSLGNQNGRPICITDSNAANGYSYENGQTCIVVAGVTASRYSPLIGQRICAPWAEINYGNYVLQNNTWNSNGVYFPNWSQCISLNGAPGNYMAQWDYNWLDRTQGNEFAVKSYPQVYYGRKTSFNRSGSVAETGLPADINNLPQIIVDFRYSETGNAERNVALESFLHTSCAAEDNNKFFEMMVWVGKPVTRTPGSLVTTAHIDGIVWDVYTNPQLTWGYVAFVAQQPLNQGTLNWNAFIQWSRNQGPAFGVPPTGNNTCLGAVELGTETFWGNGTFTLERFNVTVQ